MKEAGELDLDEALHEPPNGKGEDDLEEIKVRSLTDDTSDGGDEGDLSGTGVDVPEESALLKLMSETE